MTVHLLLYVSGVAFLLFLLAALDLSRIIRKRSGRWGMVAAEPETEFSPLMETETTPAATVTVEKGRLEKLKLPRAPEIVDQILTHTDWDGVVSGALIKNFSPLAKVTVTSAMGLRRSLRYLARSGDKPNRLFITDIAVENRFLSDIESSMIDLSRAGVKIYWYDHHPWSLQSVDALRTDCRDLIVDERYRNAAEIVHERIIPPDDYTRKLIRLLTNRLQPNEQEWGENWGRLITANQVSGSQDDISELIGKLAADRPFSMTDRFRISRMEQEEKIYTQFAQRKHREERTLKGLRFLVADLRPFRMEPDTQGRMRRRFVRQTPPASIGHQIEEYHNPDVYVLVLKNDRLAIRSGREKRFTIEPLQSLVSIKGRPCRVAGHTSAAGVYLTLGFKSKMKAIWDWSLPQEVENFIEEVKARS